jgi:hypothetical protein
MSNLILKDPYLDSRGTRHIWPTAPKESPGTRPGLGSIPDLSDLGVDYLHWVGAYFGFSVPRAAGATIGGVVFRSVWSELEAQAQSMLPC